MMRSLTPLAYGHLAVLLALSLPATGDGKEPPRPLTKSVRIVNPNAGPSGSGKDLDPLQADPRLRAKLTRNLKRPKLYELLQLVQQQTGLRLTVQVKALSPSQPVFDSLSMINVPAWQLMRKLERTLVTEGRWEKVEGGYQLTGTPQPRFAHRPRPPELLAENTSLLWYALAGLSFIVVLLALYLRRRSGDWSWLGGAAVLQKQGGEPPATLQDEKG